MSLIYNGIITWSPRSPDVEGRWALKDLKINFSPSNLSTRGVQYYRGLLYVNGNPEYQGVHIFENRKDLLRLAFLSCCPMVQNIDSRNNRNTPILIGIVWVTLLEKHQRTNSIIAKHLFLDWKNRKKFNLIANEIVLNVPIFKNRLFL